MSSRISAFSILNLFETWYLQPSDFEFLILEVLSDGRSILCLDGLRLVLKNMYLQSRSIILGPAHTKKKGVKLSPVKVV